jgi:hypothetical protein
MRPWFEAIVAAQPDTLDEFQARLAEPGDHRRPSRGRAGTSRCRRRAGGVARTPTEPEPCAARLHLRDLGRDQHGQTLRPRAHRGLRLVAPVPYGHWKTSHLLAALRHDKITAPCVIDGAANGEIFRAYVEQFLIPTLAPADIVVMANLASHKIEGVRQSHRSRRSRTLLPAAIQPRSQPHRTGLRQAQGTPARRRRTNHR